MERGESLFPRGATDRSMQGWHSGWNEAYGLYQVPCVHECLGVFLCLCLCLCLCVPVCVCVCVALQVSERALC